MNKKTENNFLEKLTKLGLYKRDDYILHIPIRYQNETVITKIKDIEISKYLLIEGIITDVELIDNKLNKYLIVTINDGSGYLRLKWIHFYYSQKKTIYYR